jgi:predicted small integral membrane protein
MESILLLIDCVAIIIAVLWFVRNATRPPGEPVGGLLRFHQTPPNEALWPSKARR